MEQINEELKKMLEEDYNNFDKFVKETSKHKVKLLNPLTSQKVVCAVGVCQYIKTLKERLGI